MLSIIIPIYNSEEYLQRCLDSIAYQTNKNFEAILIDDGSRDKSASICKQYCLSHPNFRYFYQKNAGPGAARNTGLKYVTGEYISFIDPDDFVSSSYVEKILENMNNDILFFSSIHQKSNGNEAVHTFNNNTNITFLNVLLKQNDYWDYGFTWNKCFKKDIITLNNLSFNENINHSEDEIFTLEYAKHINLANTINDIIYFYQVGIGISKKPVSLDELNTINNTLYNISNKFKDTCTSYYLKLRVINYWFNACQHSGYSFFYVYNKAKKLTDTLDKEELKKFLIDYSYDKHITLSKRTERFEKIVLSDPTSITTKIRLSWLAFYEWQKIAIKKRRHKI